jgi:hypothetical protein
MVDDTSIGLVQSVSFTTEQHPRWKPTKANQNISRHQANPLSAPGFRCSGHTELGPVEMSYARYAC